MVKFEMVAKDIKAYNSLGIPVTETRYNAFYGDEICQFQTDLSTDEWLKTANSYVGKNSTQLKEIAINNLKKMNSKAMYSAFALKAEMTKVQSMAGIATRISAIEKGLKDIDEVYIVHKTFNGNTNTIALSSIDMAELAKMPILDEVEVEPAVKGE